VANAGTSTVILELIHWSYLNSTKNCHKSELQNKEHLRSSACILEISDKK